MAKKAVRRTNIEERMIGSEPMWTSLDDLDSFAVRSRMIRAYGWYNYSIDEAHRINYLTEYLKSESPTLQKQIKTFTAYQIPCTVCWIARLLTNGCPIPDSDWEWFNAKIFALADTVKVKRPSKLKRDVAAPSVRDRMMEKVGENIAELENEIDLFVNNGYKSTFVTYDWLKENQIKGKPAVLIGEYFKPLAEELLALIGGKETDNQLREGYAKLSSAQEKRFYIFVKAILKDVDTWANNKKVDRKPRKPRSVSAVAKVSKVKVMKESDEYRLVSVDPSTLVGAKVAWTFNTKNRVLTRYAAEGPNGLQVSRSSIRSFSTDTSQSKKLRDPNNMLTKITKGSMVASYKAMLAVKAKPSVPTGRLSDTIILLKVDK